MSRDGISRRRFGLAGSALGAVLAAGRAGAAEAPGRHASVFPGNFVWGTATSAYQIEGAVREDGRGPSIWDRHTHASGTIADGSNGDIAADSFHLYGTDIELMRSLGAKAYRFSIAWPRIFPEGSGSPNETGFAFYDRLIDRLLENGIEPFVTLYHWDLPQALQDRSGGWMSRDTSNAFADYAAYVARRMTDRVKHVFTINECSRVVYLGYGLGFDAPGLKLPRRELNQVSHNVALGHGLAVRAIRAAGRPGVKVGPAESIINCVPAIETPEHVRAAETATRELNAGYLTVMLEGKYTDGFLAEAGADAPTFTAEDLGIISSPVDFVGLNIYKPDHYVLAEDSERGYSLLPFTASFPHMEAFWHKFGPEAMYWGPRHTATIWGVKSIYISENGAASSDEPAADGGVYDLDRIMYLRNYLMQLQRATSEGLPVQGYFLWSLMDNFEWSDGFTKRYGLYRLDSRTRQRSPKLSASFYREVIRNNAVV
jgi:beta-glucosidase